MGITLMSFEWSHPCFTVNYFQLKSASTRVHALLVAGLSMCAAAGCGGPAACRHVSIVSAPYYNAKLPHFRTLLVVSREHVIKVWRHAYFVV